MKEVRFFGRRKGKAIKSSKMKLLEDLLPRLKPVLPEAGSFFDMEKFFGIHPQEIWLEVGFGGGEHIAELALRNKDVGFLGAEPFLNGVVSLLAHLNGSHHERTQNTELSEDRVDNVRIWPDDVRDLFPFLKDGTFSRVFVLFPDPWPKARHAERRFINQANLLHLHRLLCDEGRLYVATDVKEYADWALEQVEVSQLFEKENENTSSPPDDWVPTRYEQKGIKAGRSPIYLIFKKKDKSLK